LPLLCRAMATACLVGYPDFTSSLIFPLTVALELPDFNGMIHLEEIDSGAVGLRQPRNLADLRRWTNREDVKLHLRFSLTFGDILTRSHDSCEPTVPADSHAIEIRDQILTGK
jgi:hypothetical protein